MPRDPDKYDFFVSYARTDNREGWISGFVEELLAAQRRFSGGREFVPFFDTEDIHSLDDWQHRLSHGLAASRLFLAFLSPNYFASEWCRREWRTWIDLEIAKHVLSAGAAPLYIVEVSGLLSDLDEQEVARRVAELCDPPGSRALFLESAAPLVRQFRRRQVSAVEPFYQQGLAALRQDDLRKVLDRLARDLDERTGDVRRAAESETTVPPYNKQFSGRLDELLDLRDRLKDDRAGVISGMHGLGGVGKTELAFTYAHAFAGAYPGGRFLVECEGMPTLPNALLGTGSFTQLPFIHNHISDEERMTSDSYFAAVTRCLRERLDERGHILLVLDNVTDAALLAPQETDQLTALGPMLHLLATTRLPAGTGRHVAWVTLGELTEAEALELLEKHRSFADDAEREAARHIVQRLQGFALAVELVGAWLAAHHSATCAGLADGLGLDDLDFMAEDQDVELRRHNNERRLQAVLGPTLAGLSDAERLVVEYAACLAPHHVPLPWLREMVVERFPELASAGRLGDQWHELCDRLLRLAIFSRADGEGRHPRLIRVHRLVQDLVRRRLSDEELSARRDAIGVLVGQRETVLQQTTQWQDARWEVEPLDALAQLWADIDYAYAGWLLHQVGMHWFDVAEWRRAELLMRRALAFDETKYGPNHTKIGLRLHNLARLLQVTGRLDEAEQMLRRALEIRERNADSEIGNTLGVLGQLLQQADQPDEAESLLRLAVTVDEEVWGSEDERVARDLDRLAILLRETGRSTEAIAMVRRALAIDERVYGVDHPNIAIRLVNLAYVSELDDAEALFRRALAIDERYYGSDHPEVATDLLAFSSILHIRNQLEEAEQLLRRAMEIYFHLKESTSDEHVNQQACLQNYKVLLKEMGKSQQEVLARLNTVAQPFGINFDDVS